MGQQPKLNIWWPESEPSGQFDSTSAISSGGVIDLSHGGQIPHWKRLGYLWWPHWPDWNVFPAPRHVACALIPYRRSVRTACRANATGDQRNNHACSLRLSRCPNVGMAVTNILPDTIHPASASVPAVSNGVPHFRPGLLLRKGRDAVKLQFNSAAGNRGSWPDRHEGTIFY